ncbi:hypothetical protein AOL_s00097g281 [Orbilia oligospora ATCC 24927]|uniref:F-box domain-containing protein n=1 Tax=Arthrobotrys oligospora (strain ATCC 24927 / CBS 115.81 / DSM 1491) TaxID=756982 RepID=G1XIV4_ARTOA|nr:hypothetical protein AOL_s00097g281 [Orbilia oligospora ATCC 24927]EGX46855.1 hypothetical protein AOL_s00097g281 [Orbilia oligospora ATCC 24927]
MSLSTSLPTELVLRVYEECQTFTDVVNLSSCCVRLRQIWNENRDVVAFPVALKVVPAFDDALITIRATAAAKSNIFNYVLNKETPKEPALIPSRFSCHLSKPKFAEIMSTLSLFTLIECALHLAHHGDPNHLRRLGRNIENRTWRHGVPYKIIPSDQESSYAFRYRVFSSMYRVFLAGAVLSWVHIYPIIKEDSPLRERFLPYPMRAPHFNISNNATPETPHLLPNLELNEPEIAYMRSFLPFQIFNLARSQIPVPITCDGFLPLAEYLIEKGKEDIELHELGPQSLENELVELEITAEDHKHGTAIQQFLMLQSAYEILRRLVADEFSYDSHMDRVKYYPEPSSSNSGHQDKSGKPIGKKELQLELFMFGCYQPEIFTFPSSLQFMEPTTSIYAKLGAYGQPYSDSYSWDTIPITKLINNSHPVPQNMNHNYIRLSLDSLFTCVCLQKLLGVLVTLSDWANQMSVMRALYMIEGRAFGVTRGFVPKQELLKYPLELGSRDILERQKAKYFEKNS